MKNILYLGLLLLILAGCKKDVTSLPDATQSGANTFGVKVNGDLWAPQKYGITQTAPILEARFGGNNGVFINARNFASEPTETEFEIYLANVQDTGTIQLNKNTGHYPNQSASYIYYIKRKLMPLNEWITSSQYTGTITVTHFDREKHIISGTFQGTLGSTDNSADPLTVTEGRFDVSIQ